MLSIVRCYRIVLSVLLLVCACCLLSAGPTMAQLTSKDIDDMREMGRQEGWTFEVSLNPATEYSLEQLCGLVVPDDWEKTAKFVTPEISKSLPSSFDWRSQVTLPSVRNQGGCGGCWAFATVGALECAIKIKDNTTVNLSEQYLVSCNNEGWGCDGGWWAHDYHEWKSDDCDSVGAVMESEFPFQYSDVPCECPYTHPYRITDWSFVGGGIEGMKQAIMDYGPISVAISANNALQAYSGGIFNGCTGTTINHAVVIVGWDDNQGTNGVWIVRNSWGSWWGEGGYGRIPYGCNQIGYGACFINYTGVKKVEFLYPDGLPKVVDPDEPTQFQVWAVGVNAGQPLSNTGQLHYSVNGGPLQTVAMTQTTYSHYNATLPALECNDDITFYVSVEEVFKGRVYDPDTLRPNRAFPITDSLMIFSDNFESDQGWSVSGDCEEGAWVRATPVDAGRGDPPTDFDGSGQCFVTGLLDGEDVDWGSTYLDSPVYDLSDGDGVISYARWYSNDYGHEPHNDVLVVSVSNDGGATWTMVETVGPVLEASGGWFEHEFWVSDFVTPTDQVRVRFNVGDLSDYSVIEAAIDNFKVSARGCQADWDHDGVMNVIDNCPQAYNPGQLDSDGDLIGDSCDACPLDSLNDIDGDGICGDIDNCPEVFNDSQIDPDHDSVGTHCDNCPGNYNPGQEDLDSNGIGDACESCCQGDAIGNIDGSPDDAVSLGDLSALVDHLFISLSPVICVEEANVDMSPDGQITLGDLTRLIDFLFVSLTPLPPCPE